MQSDVIDPSFAKEWITDFDAFEAALQSRHEYTSNLASSLALSLDEFYNKIEHVVVSAFNGFGMDDFFSKIQKSVNEYERYIIILSMLIVVSCFYKNIDELLNFYSVYRPMYKKLMDERKDQALKNQKKQLGKLKKDLKAEANSDESCFVVPGRDAGAGLSLRLDNEDDSSTEEEGDEGQGDI